MTDQPSDVLAFLDELPDPQPGLSEEDLQGCRWIEGEPAPLRRGMWCGRPVSEPGGAWCREHRAICYRLVAPRRAGAALETHVAGAATFRDGEARA
jgi:hypothetical protein